MSHLLIEQEGKKVLQGSERDGDEWTVGAQRDCRWRTGSMNEQMNGQTDDEWIGELLNPSETKVLQVFLSAPGFAHAVLGWMRILTTSLSNTSCLPCIIHCKDLFLNNKIFSYHRQTEWGGDPITDIQDTREEEAAEATADDTDQWGQEGLPRALTLQQQHLTLRCQDR